MFEPSQLFYKKQLLPIALLLTPILLFFAYIYTYAVNVPNLDDMELVYTINDLKEKPGDFFRILFRQQNDHRVAFARLGMILVYIFSGDINFRYLVLLGFLNLVLLAYSFYLIYKAYRTDWLTFAPVVILLFSPNVYEDHLWSFPAFQHSLSVAFSILSLYFLQKKQKRRWYWSLLFAFASTLTLLDGVSTLPVGFLWLIIQKRYKESFLFAFASAGWLLLYFHDFSFSSSSQLVFSPEVIIQMMQSLIVFVGSFARIVSDTYSIHASYLLGLLLLAGILFLFWKQLRSAPTDGPLSKWSLKRLELVDVCMLRILASGVMIAIGRSSFGIQSTMAVRFQVFSVTLLVLFYILVLRYVRNRHPKRFLTMALTISFLASGLAYLKYENTVESLRQSLKADAFNFSHEGVFLHQYLNLPDPNAPFYKNYDFPQFFEKSTIQKWKTADSSHPRLSFTSQFMPNEGLYATYLQPYLSLEINNVPASVPHYKAYISIQSHQDSSNFYLLHVQDKRNRLKEFLGSDSTRALFGSIPLKLPDDSYTLRLCWVENQEPKSLLLSSSYYLYTHPQAQHK